MNLLLLLFLLGFLFGLLCFHFLLLLLALGFAFRLGSLLGTVACLFLLLWFFLGRDLLLGPWVAHRSFHLCGRTLLLGPYVPRFVMGFITMCFIIGVILIPMNFIIDMRAMIDFREGFLFLGLLLFLALFSWHFRFDLRVRPTSCNSWFRGNGAHWLLRSLNHSRLLHYWGPWGHCGFSHGFWIRTWIHFFWVAGVVAVFSVVSLCSTFLSTLGYYFFSWGTVLAELSFTLPPPTTGFLSTLNWCLLLTCETAGVWGLIGIFGKFALLRIALIYRLSASKTVILSKRGFTASSMSALTSAESIF